MAQIFVAAICHATGLQMKSEFTHPPLAELPIDPKAKLRTKFIMAVRERMLGDIDNVLKFTEISQELHASEVIKLRDLQDTTMGMATTAIKVNNKMFYGIS